MKRYKDTNLMVTNDGRVFGPKGERKTNTGKYPQASWRDANRRSHNFAVHRMVAELYIPNPDDKPQVNHKDGNKLNNHWTNLEWVTDSENKKHAFANGLMTANRTNSKLKPTDVHTIRYLHNLGWSRTKLAEEFKVHKETIGDLLLGKTWSHI